MEAPPGNQAKIGTELIIITCFTMDWFLFRDLNTKPLDSIDYNNDQNNEERDRDGSHLDPANHLTMEEFSCLSESGILVMGVHPI